MESLICCQKSSSQTPNPDTVKTSAFVPSLPRIWKTDQKKKMFLKTHSFLSLNEQKNTFISAELNLEISKVRLPALKMKENTGGGRKYVWSHFTWNITEHLKRQVFLLNCQHSTKVLPWVTREGSYILPKWPYKPSFTTVLEVSTVRHLPLVVVIPAPINRWCSRDEELIKESIHLELAFASSPYTICKSLPCLVN